MGLTDDSGNAVDDPSDTSWDKIAESIKTKLKCGFDKLKVKLTDLLGINPEDVEGEVEWADIGKKILDKVTEKISHKGDFLKKLILGDEFNEKSTWLDVGTKISGYLKEAFSEGGILDAMLGNVTEQATAIAAFAGELISGFANWLTANSDQVVGIITTIAEAIAKAAGPIVEALSTILSNPDLWVSIGDALKAIFKAIFGDEATKFLFGDEDRKKATDLAKEMMNSSDPAKYVKDRFGDTESAKEVLRLYQNIMDKDMRGAGTTVQDWDELSAALAKAEAEAKTAAAGTEALGEAAEAVSGDYDITFNIKQNGDIPEIPGSATHGDGNQGEGGGHHFAKGSWDVPHDMYAKLHRNEMVLTASQARQYREGNAASNNGEIVSAIQSLRNDLSNLKLVVGRKMFGRAVVNYGGDRMSNYIGGSDSRLASGYGT